MTAADGAGRTGAGRAFGALALALAVPGLLPAARWLGGEVAWYRGVAVYWIVIGGGLVVALLAASRLAGPLIDRALAAGSRVVFGADRRVFVTLAAAVAIIVSATVFTWCFGRQPQNADEVAQLWQSRILLSGRLSLPADPNFEFFAVDNIVDRGRWYSQFPVGGPVVLALGALLHASWLVNPLLAGAAVVIVHGLAREAFDDATGRIAALLMAVSPMVAFMSASYMNHVPVMCLVALALWALVRWSGDTAGRMTTTRSAAVIGAALGAAFTIRPLDALLAALVIGAAQLHVLMRGTDETISDDGRRARLRSFAWQLLGGLIPVLLLAVVHVQTTGAPFRFGYEVLYGDAHRMGFHLDPYGTVHSPLRAAMYTATYLLRLSVGLLEWPLPGLGLLAVALLAIRRPGRWEIVLAAMLVATLAGYAFYWHLGEFRGPRFLFTALPAVFILLARGQVLLTSRLDRRGAPIRARALRLLLPCCVAISWSAERFPSGALRRVNDFRSAPATSRIAPDSVAHAADLHDALVFVSERWASRLIRRLWALDVDRASATRLMFTGELCALSEAVDAEEARGVAATRGRIDRLARATLAGEAAPASRTECALEAARDDAGVAAFAPFMVANEIGRDGRVGGNVVYAMDLGARNERLRARFGSRTWYRFTVVGGKAGVVPY